MAPTLFANVKTYARSLEDGTVDLGRALSDTTPILVFCQNFFAQFFENVLGHPLTSIDEDMKEEAATVRLSWSQAEAEAPTRLLIALFEELCDEWPEVLGLSYGTLREDMLEFHGDYLPNLLEAIADWSATIHDDALQREAREARSAYRKGLASLTHRVVVH